MDYTILVQYKKCPLHTFNAPLPRVEIMAKYPGSGDLDYSLNYNPSSWNKLASVLYVEQPVRVGYSVAEEHAQHIRTEKEVARDFRNFLLAFMEVFPEYKGR